MTTLRRRCSDLMASLTAGLELPLRDAWGIADSSDTRANVWNASGRISTIGEPTESGALLIKHRRGTQQFAEARRPGGAVGKCPLMRRPV